jgi:small subunit ribosomal protein S20
LAKSKTPQKRALTAEKRRVSNASQKSLMKTVIKKFDAALADKNTSEAQTRLATASSVIDKTAGKGIIHKNKAARKKSRLAKKLNTVLH